MTVELHCIVNTCYWTKLDGGLETLNTAHTDVVEWLNL